MKMFYRKALLAEGFDEKSEKYKEIDKCFNTDLRAYQRDRQTRAELGITFNRLSTFIGEDADSNDCFASDEDVEEKILHEIELERLRDCLNKLPVEDRELLLRYYGGPHGELKKIATERGVPYKGLHKKVKRLLKKLRVMMDNPDF